MRRGFVTGCLIIVLAGSSTPSRADFVISIGGASIAQGSTGAIDVMLSSNASSAAPDILNNLAFTLQITGPGFLQFAGAQNFSYLNASNYVFSGDSLDYMTSSPGGSTSTTSYTNDTFTGLDSTNSTNPVSLDSSNTPLLLAVLTLDATSTAVNDSYTISLVPPTGDGSVNTSGSTYFDNFNFGTGTETSSVAYTSNPGTVKIIASAVPEPGSIILGLTAVVLLAGARAAGGRRRSKRQPG